MKKCNKCLQDFKPESPYQAACNYCIRRDLEEWRTEEGREELVKQNVRTMNCRLKGLI